MVTERSQTPKSGNIPIKYGWLDLRQPHSRHRINCAESRCPVLQWHHSLPTNTHHKTYAHPKVSTSIQVYKKCAKSNSGGWECYIHRNLPIGAPISCTDPVMSISLFHSAHCLLHIAANNALWQLTNVLISGMPYWRLPLQPISMPQDILERLIFHSQLPESLWHPILRQASWTHVLLYCCVPDTSS